MKNSFIWIFFLFLLASCSSRPRNVLPENKMVDLMADMELAEAYINTARSSSSQDRIDIGKSVLQAHGVSQETLDTTLAWYGRNMDEYTELFEKVDKKILQRRDKLTEESGIKIKESDNLWIYSPHLVVSPLSGRDNFVFSIPHPPIEKGDLLKLTFALPNATSIKSSFGVEYTDGSGEAAIAHMSSKRSVEFTFQTDTSRTVSRIFGIMNLKEMKDNPIYVDSLKILAEPFDSLSYLSKRRSQKSFGGNFLNHEESSSRDSKFDKIKKID